MLALAVGNACWRTIVLLVVMLSLCLCDMHAQTLDAPPKVGLSPWAFRYALAGQLADILTTEAALAQGGQEANVLMRHRGVRIPLKLALPLLQRWAFKEMPRRQANTYAVIL